MEFTHLQHHFNLNAFLFGGKVEWFQDSQPISVHL